MNKFPVLETERLLLREFRFHDMRCFSLLRRDWMARPAKQIET